MTKKINRRELIQKTLPGFGALSLPISLTACGDDADSNTQPNTQVQFLHGVASGDPLQTQVIIWTRVTPSGSSARLEVLWEVATDADFKHIQSLGKPKLWQRKYSRYSLQYAHVQIIQRVISMFIKKWPNRMSML